MSARPPAAWRISTSLAYRLIAEGRLPHVRIGARQKRGKIIIREEESAILRPFAPGGVSRLTVCPLCDWYDEAGPGDQTVPAVNLVREQARIAERKATLPKNTMMVQLPKPTFGPPNAKYCHRSVLLMVGEMKGWGDRLGKGGRSLSHTFDAKNRSFRSSRNPRWKFTVRNITRLFSPRWFFRRLLRLLSQVIALLPQLGVVLVENGRS